MARFPNSLGFLITSGLINNTRSEICAPVITAVVRDLKKYMKLKQQATGQRILPVGFGGGQYDGDVKVLNYLTAGDESSRIDLWTVCSLSRGGVLQVSSTDCQQQCTAFASDQNLGKGLNRLDGLVRPVLVAIARETKNANVPINNRSPGTATPKSPSCYPSTAPTPEIHGLSATQRLFTHPQ